MMNFFFYLMNYVMFKTRFGLGGLCWGCGGWILGLDVCDSALVGWFWVLADWSWHWPRPVWGLIFGFG